MVSSCCCGSLPALRKAHGETDVSPAFIDRNDMDGTCRPISLGSCSFFCSKPHMLSVTRLYWLPVITSAPSLSAHFRKSGTPCSGLV